MKFTWTRVLESQWVLAEDYIGKAKHVDTQYHWVQDRVAMHYFRLKKVGTDEMLADVLTKPVTEEKMNKALRGMNFYFLVGEHHLTLRA